MSKKKESKINITLQEAIDLKEILTAECQAIGKEFKKTANKLLFDQLEIKNENLKRVSNAILKANCDTGNNENIKKLDITKRLKEVIESTLRDLRRENSILGKVKKFIGLNSSRYNEEELLNKLTELEATCFELNQTLSELNSKNKIELSLINV